MGEFGQIPALVLIKRLSMVQGLFSLEWTRLSGLLWLDMEGQNKIMTLSTLLLGPVLNNYPIISNVNHKQIG